MVETFKHVKLNEGFIITTCALLDSKDSEKAKAVGISVCSPRDNYNRKLGNTIAKGRAYKAAEHKKNISPVRENLRLVFTTTYKGLYFGE